MRRVSVVLPIYRTAQYLRELHRRLVAALAPLGDDFELVMVDDGSPDDAWLILLELAAKDRHIKAIRLSRNFGQHPAISAGFDHCTGDAIILMDADLQDQPENVPLLLSHLQGDIDAVYTIKQKVGNPRWTSWLFHSVLGRLTGQIEPTNIGTFRAFTGRFLEAVQSYPERRVLFGPLMIHVGFQTLVIPVSHEPRADGRSSYSFRKRLALAVDTLISYTDLPHRFLIVFGLIVLTITGLYACALVIEYLFAHDRIPSGLTLLAMLSTLSLGATTLGLGIIGMYVYRVFQEVLQRPRYIVARRVNINSQERRNEC